MPAIISQTELGKAAHREAARLYRADHPNHHMILDTRVHLPNGSSVGTIAGPPRPEDFPHGRWSKHVPRFDYDPYLLCQLWSLWNDGGFGPPAPRAGNKPDLANLDLHHVYEVKPANVAGVREGWEDWERYRALLTQGDANFRAAEGRGLHSDLFDRVRHMTWQAGSWDPPDEPVPVYHRSIGTTLIVFRRLPATGLILWHELDPDVDGKRWVIPLALLLLSRRIAEEVKKLPQSQGEAELEADRWRRSQPSMMTELDFWQTLVGIAVVALALLLAFKMLGLIVVGSLALVFILLLLQKGTPGRTLTVPQSQVL